MERIASFDFLPLHAGTDGRPTSAAQLDDLARAVDTDRYTDVIVIGHGFRNDAGEATSLYRRFLEGFDAHRAHASLAATLQPRSYLVAGVFWPSKKFSEGQDDDEGGAQSVPGDVDEREVARLQLDAFLQETDEAARARLRAAFGALEIAEDDPDAQDRFVAAVFDTVPFDDADGNEGLAQIRAKHGSELIASLEAPIFLPTAASDDDGGVTAVGGAGASDENGGVLMVGGFFKSVMGRVGQVLNMGTWYTMKRRAGDVGQHLVADAVRRIARATPAGGTPRIHLVGHSLGGRMMASAARALASPPAVQVTSLVLLEAAFSHYGFSAHAASAGGPGFFRAVIDRNVVRGPIVSTYSYQDTVVGKAYAIASRLAGDTVKAVGDKDDRFGGIGRNGAQETSEVATHRLASPGVAYRFAPGIVHNVDGTGGGILNHSDVTNPKVTWAFASAMAQTG